MKKIMILLIIVGLQSFATTAHPMTRYTKNPCNNTDIEIVNDENFELDINKSKIIGAETIIKREEVSVFEDLTEKEKESLLRKAKKLTSSISILFKILIDNSDNRGYHNHRNFTRTIILFKIN